MVGTRPRVARCGRKERAGGTTPACGAARSRAAYAVVVGAEGVVAGEYRGEPARSSFGARRNNAAYPEDNKLPTCPTMALAASEARPLSEAGTGGAASMLARNRATSGLSGGGSKGRSDSRRDSSASATAAPTITAATTGERLWTAATPAVTPSAPAATRAAIRHELAPASASSRMTGSRIDRWRKVNPPVAEFTASAVATVATQAQVAGRMRSRQTPTAASGSAQIISQTPG